VPYNEKVVTPSLYGLQAFVMMPLSELRKVKKETAKRTVAPVSKRPYNIRLNRTLLRNAVAVAVAVFTFFALSIPIENTYMAKGSYAQLLPMDVFETIEGQSVLTTPVKKDSEQSQKTSKRAARKAAKEAKKKNSSTTTTTTQQPTQPAQQPANDNNSQPVNNNSKPVENNSKPVQNNSQPVNNTSKPVQNNSNAQQTKPAQQPTNNNQNNQQTKPAQNNNNNNNKPAANANNNGVSNKPATNVQTEKDGKYHVIVASSITRTKAEELVAKLKKLGYTLATILDNGSTLRVSLTSSTDRDAANKAMNQARNKDGFSDAWVMSY
jgi:predicted secreted protein/cell division septation protein DedD